MVKMTRLVNSTKYLRTKHAFLQKIQEEGTLQNSSYEASIPLIPKPEKDIMRKENTNQYSS